MIFDEVNEVAGERRHLAFLSGVEQEMDQTLVLGLDEPAALFLVEFVSNPSLDRHFFLTDRSELVLADVVLLDLGLLLVRQVAAHGGVEPVLVLTVQLILEGVFPVLLFGQQFH